MGKICSIILFLGGIFSISYYLVILFYLGFRKDFSLVWMALSVLCFSAAEIIRRCQMTSFKHKTALGYLLFCVCLLGILLFVIVEGIIVKNANHKPMKNADYMIVLGAQVKKNVVSRVLKERLEKAYEYLVENENTIVIVSGGKGDGEEISEGQAMFDYLVDKGISAERIVIEQESTNTNENIKYSSRFLEKDKSVVVVTNGFHVYRGVSIAKKQGFEHVEGLGAKTDRILFVNYYVREAFGVVKDTIVGNM